MSRWDAPEGVESLAAPQRVAFGLVCAEHVRPSFELQAHACPASLPEDALSIVDYGHCLEAMWKWLDSGERTMPTCISEEQVLAAESRGEMEGLASFVEQAHVILWYATSSYNNRSDCADAGHRVLEAVGGLVEELLGPRPTPPTLVTVHESASSWMAREEAIASHELVRIERGAQAEAVAALRGGTRPADLREPAQAVGRQIAEWAARAP